MRLWVAFSLMVVPLTVACGGGDNNQTPDAAVDKGTTQLDGMGGDTTAPDTQTPDTSKPDVTVDAGPPSVWKEMSNPAGTKLYGIAGTAKDNIFAVGKGGVIIHYDGTGWTKMTNSETADLFSVVALSPNTVYAAGDGMVLKYDGSSWSKTHSSSYNSGYRAIWAGKTKVMVVGTNGTFRHNSSSYWSSSPYTRVKVDLNALWGVSDTEVYAVGAKGTILKYDGSKWTAMASGTSSNLYAIWGRSAKEIYAAGNDGTILKFDGLKWNALTINSSSYFRGIVGTSATNLMVVGQPLFKPAESIFQYDGTAWTNIPPKGAMSLNSIWAASATEIFIVGDSAILRYGGK